MYLLGILAFVLFLQGDGRLSLSYLEDFRLLHEYEHVDTAVVEFSHPVAGSLRRRFTKREATKSYRQGRKKLSLTITLTTSKKVLHFDVEKTDTVHNKALVVEHFGDTRYESLFESKGCHYRGTFENGGVVSLQICEGVVVGGACDTGHEYAIHPHPQVPPLHRKDNYTLPACRSPSDTRIIAHHRNGSPAENKTPDQSGKNTTRDDSSSAGDSGRWHAGGRVMIAWKKLGLQRPWRDDMAYERAKRQAKTHVHEDIDNGDDAPLPLDDDKDLKWEGKEEEEVDNEGRRPMTAEFAVVLDEDYVSRLQEKYGYTSRQDVLNFVAIKFNGVQAVFGNRDVVGVVFNILVSRIDIFWKNPLWYTNQTNFNTRQLSRAGTICSSFPNDEMSFYDSVAVMTQNIAGKAGVAFVSGVCRRMFKCYICKTTNLNWLCEAHEFGHTLGFMHDWSSCGPVRGFMRTNQYIFLPCYRDFLLGRAYDPAMKCLFVRSAPTGHVVETKKTFPVLALGLDKFCETSFMSGSENLHQHDRPCPSVACGVVNASDRNFGLMRTIVTEFTAGRLCGENKVCLKGGECVDITNQTTTISLAAYYQNRRAGGWSEWSSFSESCSASCGTGLRVAYRLCDSPPPLMGDFCQGSKFKAILCSTEPCVGDPLKDDAELRQDRADVMCQWLISRGVLDQNKYTGKGDYLSDKGDAAVQCTVGCRKASSPGQTSRDPTAFQPDGALCGTRNFDYYLRGVQYRCMRGVCTGFDCNNRSMDGSDDVTVKDTCGVCGGDNSSCTSGAAITQVPEGKRVRLFNLPAGTTNILVAFDYSQHRSLETELYSKDWQPVIQFTDTRRRVIDNRRNPENFAGVHWTYVHEAQFLSASGTLTQPVILWLYNSGSRKVNQSLIWRFQSPDSSPDIACENGGIPWNGGCLCKIKFYGTFCNDTCPPVCHNGGYTEDGQCTRCTCNEYSRGLFCESCIEGRTGADCKDCAVTRCYNGGLYNRTGCTCKCPDGCSSKDCSACGPDLGGHDGADELDKISPASAAQNVFGTGTGSAEGTKNKSSPEGTQQLDNRNSGHNVSSPAAIVSDHLFLGCMMAPVLLQKIVF